MATPCRDDRQGPCEATSGPGRTKKEKRKNMKKKPKKYNNKKHEKAKRAKRTVKDKKNKRMNCERTSDSGQNKAAGLYEGRS